MKRRLKIAVPVPTAKVFDYFAESDDENLVGRRALVPFGSRTLTGVVVEQDCNSDAPADKIKSVFEILDETPVLPESILKLTKWIAAYYLSSWGETLKAALPAGMSPKSALNVSIVSDVAEARLQTMRKKAPKRAALLEELMKHTSEVTVGYLEKRLKTKTISAQIEALESAGIIALDRKISRGSRPLTVQAAAIDKEIADDENEIVQIIDSLEKKAPKQAELLAQLFLLNKRSDKPVAVAPLLSDTSAPRSALKALEEKGFVRVFEIEATRNADDDGEKLAHKNEAELPLTTEQQNALDEINSGIDSDEYSPFMLFGVTGSGKTLVYIHAIRRALDAGKTALLMVPEISLTPQLIDRFKIVFGDSIAVAHSKLSMGSRFDAHRAAIEGKAKIVIGTRSAVFAPLKNLGLIIVDEEHEFSYKQDTNPRYHGRDCAIVRATMEKAAIVLGSATPSIESYFNANSGKYKLLKIAERADGAKLPEIKLLDSLAERKRGAMDGAFSRELIDEILARVEKKEGTIIFQNRRGFSSFLECADCGHVPMCKNCSVALTYHKKIGDLRCHYCGYTEKATAYCVECGGMSMREIGAGSQRVEEELAEILQERGVEAKIERVDLDTTSRKNSLRKILYRFSKGETDILVGTQMAAKGLDIDRVTLVGAVNADLQLFLPDFRSAERAFQILTQVSGRAGRSGARPGKVIIQSSHCYNRAIRAVLARDYETFYKEEIDERKDALYPPYSRFVSIEFSSTKQNESATSAAKFASLLPKNSRFFEVLGPSEPRIYKLKNRYRNIVVVKNIKKSDPTGKYLRESLSIAIEKYVQYYSKSTTRMSVDVDSFSSL